MLSERGIAANALTESHCPLLTFVNDRFGTHRGLVRLGLAHGALALGRYRDHSQVDWAQVRRVVPVCMGNICRSPFAEAALQQKQFATASFGLSTDTGKPADPIAQEIAATFGHDLSAHRATNAGDFRAAAGDLYLVMEDRHLAPLRAVIGEVAHQAVLLGLWSRPPFPLLYDPFSLSPTYFQACFGRIDTAISRLAAERDAFQAAQPQSQP